MKEKSFGQCLLPVLAGMAALGVSGFAAAVQVNSGWTLVGNGRNAVIDVASTFGTNSAPVTGITSNITTVWKWDAVNAKWAFFTPTMDLNQLATYSTSKGYAVLKSILPGEGYWVNAKNAVTVPDPVGLPFNLDKWNLTGGWNLVSTGSNVTAGQFAASISPFTATTVWAWDPVSAGWYFYAPSLDANNTLTSYINSKGYKNFTPALADGLGFWVNRAAVTGSPTASLPALDQAKQMFAELRTTVNSWVDTSNTGALNDQLTRMSNDIQANPQGGVQKTVERASVLGDMITMYEHAKAYTVNTPNGLMVGPDVNGAGSYLISTNNFSFPWASVYGGGSSSYCWAGSATPASVTKITCVHAGSNSFTGSKLKLDQLVLTSTATANSYTYTATRYDSPVTFDQFGSPGFGAPVLVKDSLNHSFPVGTGSVSKTVAGSVTTGLAFNGTFPPANSVIIGNPPPFAGTYTSSVLFYDGFTHTENITVTGLSVVGHHTFTDGISSGSFDWTGTITRSPVSPNQGTITGSGTITNQGTRSFTLDPYSSIMVNADGGVSVWWSGMDPTYGQIGGGAYGSVPTGPDSGAETVTLSMARSALPTANTYHYALSGSVVIPGLVSPADVTVLDPNRVVTLSLDAGSYVDLDETNSATTGSRPLAVNFAGTAQTLASRFTGSVLAKSFMNDADGLNWAPTDVTAVGTFTDTSAGGVGTILSGTLTAIDTTYGLYHSMQPPSTTNHKNVVISLTNGALKLPSRPTMGLTLSSTQTNGPTAGTISGQYTYDNGLVITLSGTHGGATNSLTITNQDGITVTIPNIGNSPISKGVTSLGYISNGIIYYSDATFESLK